MDPSPVPCKPPGLRRAGNGQNAAPSPDSTYSLGRAMDLIAIDDFEKVDIRVGTVVDAAPFPEARKPAIKLWVEFGAPIGLRQSSAQLTVHYTPDRLIGRQVIAVVNFPPRRIAGFESQVLVLGMPDENGAVVLLRPDIKVPDGGKMF